MTQIEVERLRSARIAPAACPIQAETEVLASLVLLTYNRWDCTERLLKSLSEDVGRTTPVELVWVDNGSVDGTRAAMRSWLSRHKDAFVAIHERMNPTNHGFIVGVNEGACMARGSHWVLINSDATVSPGWLDRLVGAADQDGTAASGPISDGMPWNQSLEQMGSGLCPSPVIYGFCMVMRRSAVHNVGLLDERYGRGVIEIEDWCERASRAGWQLVVDTDVFVGHGEPHASYTARVNSMLHIRNRDLFTRKWGKGPYFWGDRHTPSVSYPYSIVTMDLDYRGIAARLNELGPSAELIIIKPHSDTADHLDWTRLARSDPRLNVVCVPHDWPRRETDIELFTLANARGQRIVIESDVAHAFANIRGHRP